MIKYNNCLDQNGYIYLTCPPGILREVIWESPVSGSDSADWRQLQRKGEELVAGARREMCAKSLLCERKILLVAVVISLYYSDARSSRLSLVQQNFDTHASLLWKRIMRMRKRIHVDLSPLHV